MECTPIPKRYTKTIRFVLPLTVYWLGMSYWKKIKKVSLVAVATLIIVVVACNIWVIQSTEARVFSDASQIPHNKIALVLGTSSRLVGGAPNPFFVNRMARAAELFTLRKVDHFILSGDNRSRYYNEPETMRDALRVLGVPDSVITLDFAGLRTFDSIVRSREIFGVDSLTIITQTFHSYRALFISDRVNIHAVAVVANDPRSVKGALVYFREYLARTLAVMDLYLLNTVPKHLGAKEKLGA
jgi:SanA protein